MVFHCFILRSKFYRSATVYSNTVNLNCALNSKFSLRSAYDLIEDQRINFHLVRGKTLPTNCFKLTVSGL